MATVRKHSRKRDAILACLRSTTCHPTAEWVYQQLKPAIPDLSLGTVYRNLSMFKDEGLVLPSNRSSPPTVPTEITRPSSLNIDRFR